MSMKSLRIKAGVTAIALAVSFSVVAVGTATSAQAAPGWCS